MTTVINLKNHKVDIKDIKFVSELDLQKVAQEDNWFHCDCGHDCCPCDSQCK